MYFGSYYAGTYYGAYFSAYSGAPAEETYRDGYFGNYYTSTYFGTYFGAGTEPTYRRGYFGNYYGQDYFGRYFSAFTGVARSGTTLTLDCPCCCPCKINLERQLHGTCVDPGNSDVTVISGDAFSAQDCDEGLVCDPGCTHTFGSGITLRYKKGRILEFVPDATVACDGDDLAFAEWTMTISSGSSDCILNLDADWYLGDSVWCAIGVIARLEFCTDMTCPEINLTAHYAEPLVCPVLEPQCLQCYIDNYDGVSSECEDTEGFNDNYASACS